jgi:serine/threonine protein kinase/formylglycine-generating enzyme required for sulfatase activity
MTPQAGSLLVLVCPECGKRYKGDPTKPEARYQCPADQSTLIRLESAAEREHRRKKTADQSGHDAPRLSEEQPFHEQRVSISEPQNGDPDDQKTKVSRANAGGAGAAAAPAPAPPTLTQVPIGLTESGLLKGFNERRSVVATIEWPSGADPEGGPIRKYEKKGVIGKGGMGEVMKVLDRDLRREVAMKMLRPQRPDGGVSAEDVFRFMKEAQATGRLEHPNIIPVHDLGVDGEGRIYFTLKYVQGVSLKEVIRGRSENASLEDGRKFRAVFNARHLIEIFISVCQGVAYAHSKGIIHRDLKPENVMLGKFGEVLVMDWGLAKVLAKSKTTQASGEASLDLSLRPTLDSSMTLEGDIAGTPSYMSPEQAAGKNSELDERTDVYSLGAMLYEMLGGEPPYSGMSALETIQKVSEGTPPATVSGTCDFRPVPRELRAICEKAMQRDPAKRYPSVEALRDDLQAYLETRPVSSCPDTLVQKAVKFIRRNRHRATSVASMAAALLALIFGGWFIYWQITAYKLLTHAESEVALGKNYYVAYQSGKLKVNEDDPMQATILATAGGDYADFYRDKLNSGIDSAREVLEIFPRHERARRFLAESYMELWRLARDQNNTVMMSVARGEVQRYAPGDEKLLTELNGFGKLELTLDPPDADAYLFSFETLHGFDKDGNALPERMVPVPYDPSKHQPDPAFMAAERKRSREGEPLAEDASSIFHLDPTPGSRLGTGKVSLAGLPPGSYLLLLLALGHKETQVPIRMDRRDLVQRTIVLPPQGAVPPGFLYVAASRPIIGGEAANAFPRHIQPVPAFVLSQEEITMREYAEFLKFLVRNGKTGEARARVPRERGGPLAVLSASGELAAVNPRDAEAFLASPVRGVSHGDALAYAEWRSRRDHIQYRLPTETEWETACRGTDGRTFSWGNKPAPGVAIASVSGNTDWNWRHHKDESPWGAHNMSGSVAEWTALPFDPQQKSGEFTVRGNAWGLVPAGLACAFRTAAAPDATRATIGFRLAADWPVKPSIGPDLPKPVEKPEPPKPKIEEPPPQPQKPKSKVEKVLEKLGLDR